MENNATNGFSVQSIDATVQYRRQLVPGGWRVGSGAATVDEVDDWPIVLAVDLACRPVNRKSMVALLPVKGERRRLSF